MTDVLDVVRAQRPERPNLDEATRSRLRARLTGELDLGTPVRPELGRARNGVRSVERDRRIGRRLTAVAAGALLLVGIGAVWAGVNRSDGSAPQAQQPSTELPNEQERPAGNAVPAPSGAMILDQLPAALTNATGYSYVGTSGASEPPFPDNTWIQRWYTATMDRPELQPRLKLASTSATQEFPPEALPPRQVQADAERLTVRGTTGWMYEDPEGGGLTIAFQDDETVFVLTGYQLSVSELLAAAEHTTLADSSGVGAVIEPDALPTGLIERAVGISDEGGFESLESLQHPPAEVRWYDARPDGAPPASDDPSLWLSWRIEDADSFSLRRLEYDAIADTTVHGVPAFTATSNGDPAYLGVVWSEGGHTYTLGGRGLDREAVLEAANQLRPVTDAEWAALEVTAG